MSFLPITKEEMTARGWEAADFVYVTGDAYVDHPSFVRPSSPACWKARATGWRCWPSPALILRRI